MAERCLRIALATDPDHAESLCNLGVLKMQENKMDEARHLFHSATLKGPHLYEAHFNLALLLHEVFFPREILFYLTIEKYLGWKLRKLL